MFSCSLSWQGPPGEVVSENFHFDFTQKSNFYSFKDSDNLTTLIEFSNLLVNIQSGFKGKTKFFFHAMFSAKKKHK